jgi:hypothetical protein
MHRSCRILFSRTQSSGFGECDQESVNKADMVVAAKAVFELPRGKNDMHIHRIKTVREDTHSPTFAFCIFRADLGDDFGGIGMSSRNSK